jgi:iron(III) transport system substrate-binding protein
VNSYYVARMLAGEAGSNDAELAGRLKVVFPDPTHVNISGAGVTRHSDNPEAATKLIEFLASPSGGRGYAEANHEYPLRGFGDQAVLARFGTFREDGVSAAQMGATNTEAVQVMKENGWQ